MLGLNGSYTNLASGVRAVGINPANLAVYNNETRSIFDFSLGLGNNFFSIRNYNTLSGAHLNDSTHTNYYPEKQIFDKFGGIGFRMRQSFNIPLFGFSVAKHQYALTSMLRANIDLGLSDGMIKTLFSGNSLGKEIDLRIEEVLFLTQETGFSYGHSFSGFSAGFTAKYILGLYYFGVETLPLPALTTDLNGLYGNAQYMIRQDIGGSGIGLDVGIITDEFDDGFRFGISIINLFGTINWSQESFIRDQLSPTLNMMDFRQNEFMYVNLVFDSIAASSFIADSEDAFIYYEMYKVFPLKTINNLDISNDSLIVELTDGTYLIPSEGDYKLVDLYGDGSTSYTILDNYSKYSKEGAHTLKTRQPMYLRMSLSKRWEDQAIVAIDFVTGFSNRFSSSSTWRMSLGTEITRYKNQFLRLGYAIGGLEGKSISFGYGKKFGNLYFDVGLSINGGFALDSAKGFNVATGFIWKTG